MLGAMVGVAAAVDPMRTPGVGGPSDDIARHGSSAIPQIGQEPGTRDRTWECIGQT
jgi:hypothetical protein